MKTYTFRVVVEPDEGGFHAYCPALRRLGAVTQGSTPEEALKNINEVVQMIVDELREDGIPLPAELERHQSGYGRCYEFRRRAPGGKKQGDAFRPNARQEISSVPFFPSFFPLMCSHYDPTGQDPSLCWKVEPANACSW